MFNVECKKLWRVVISKKGMKVDRGKAETIIGMQAPTNLKDL